ncbi:3-hexulose-6-phosphate synthase [Anoxybacillus vitaminiphilus]|jgi:3-hexulose-6-phosphate synthase|uniref:3-hexulose-6-phosphate synthase n=2 Tax=Paranoxybacillus vitaminiphilus TaxID=581036 RepID=A0A327YLX2_9BACL|nr:3-hexulose-6-phosphate synthase [Anoxybacillus vitaminiphilus]RAK22074.1 3-hexulose-6-phosphate synthase [Anoxybacillus vitaminiphilus]
MNLQLALDRLTEARCFEIVQQVDKYVDWIEIGTGVIKEYGIRIVAKMKEKYPDKWIVADMKTCDAGKHEALQAFQAGADITTVMAFSEDKTILDSLEIAQKFNKNIMVDLLGLKNRERIYELKNMGVQLVSLHFGKDSQQQTKFNLRMFDLVKGISGLKIAVAGGIDLQSLSRILSESPYAIIIGSAITNADNPQKVAYEMKKTMNSHTGAL